MNGGVSTFVNYSWQDDPEVLDDPNPYPVIELALPPTHRFNIGGTYSGTPPARLAVRQPTPTRASGRDVLDSPYHGYTDAFTMVNGSIGFKWNRRITTSLKSTNLFNKQIQQHVFGDILGRSVMAEVRFDLVR